ncbi:hypothetical protein VTL71DRAFT_2166 [Oculimacula yallundae]|uniref:Uncharacterized protein n=1 Tax=Oculimacula yallundae TaxID=86028 RepID=A0ABR4C852_9HELO
MEPASFKNGADLESNPFELEFTAYLNLGVLGQEEPEIALDKADSEVSLPASKPTSSRETSDPEHTMLRNASTCTNRPIALSDPLPSSCHHFPQDAYNTRVSLFRDPVANTQVDNGSGPYGFYASNDTRGQSKNAPYETSNSGTAANQSLEVPALMGDLQAGDDDRNSRWSHMDPSHTSNTVHQVVQPRTDNHFHHPDRMAMPQASNQVHEHRPRKRKQNSDTADARMIKTILISPHEPNKEALQLGARGFPSSRDISEGEFRIDSAGEPMQSYGDASNEFGKRLPHTTASSIQQDPYVLPSEPVSEPVTGFINRAVEGNRYSMGLATSNGRIVTSQPASGPQRTTASSNNVGISNIATESKRRQPSYARESSNEDQSPQKKPRYNDYQEETHADVGLINNHHGQAALSILPSSRTGSDEVEPQGQQDHNAGHLPNRSTNSVTSSLPPEAPASLPGLPKQAPMNLVLHSSTFTVPYGFGTVQPVGKGTCVEFPCGNPAMVSRKGYTETNSGYADKHSMIKYRNEILEANEVCRQHGLYFDSSKMLQKVS